jgi:hypothetical protein
MASIFKVEAEFFSKTSDDAQRTTWRYFFFTSIFDENIREP